MFSIFAFLLVVTFSDGVTDEFQIATPDMDSCQHLQAHIAQWADETGAVIEHLSECQEINAA